MRRRKAWWIAAVVVASGGRLDAQGRHVREALAMGDTAVAVRLLRDEVRRAGSAQTECLLATLLTRTAPAEATRWKERVEAERLFERALRQHPDPLCLLEFASLRSRQGMRVDAGRMASRAFALVAERPELQTPTVLAELYYRRALPLLAWVRQFDHMIFVTDLPVSTPACRDSGLFCEAYAQPADFFALLAGRPSLEHLVADEREAARALLDSALQSDPGHAGALAGALALAAAEADWSRFQAYAAAAHAASPDAAGPLLALLTAELRRGQGRAATAWFDSLQAALGPDALARFEGLALVADTALRQRLSGEQMVVYAEAVWGLSDPFYLSAHNERRIEHYARVHLAELLFSDPERGTAGRDTPQGRLVIRYGLPARIFVMQADQRLKLSDAQREMLNEILSCATQPNLHYRPGLQDIPPACAHGYAPGQAMQGGGRWEFWYYAEGGIPFVFERPLGSWTARHMFETESVRLDSALHRALPSSYDPPFRRASISALVTRFPRPGTPGIEIWGEFGWDGPVERPSGTVRLGMFLHSRADGTLRTHAILDRRPQRPGVVRFDRQLPVAWGTFQLAVEGMRFDRDDAAAQQRHRVDLAPPSPDEGTLWMSDLLIGDSATASNLIGARADVQFFGRADSVLSASAPVAVYWEIYGIGTDNDATARYRVRLTVEQEGVGVGGAIVRFLGRIVGVAQPAPHVTEWQVARPVRNVLPELLVLEDLPESEALTITIAVADQSTGRTASTRRVVTVRR